MISDEKAVLENLLLARIKEGKAALDEMLQRMSGHWTYEDHYYRFYHESFKVYKIQETTEAAVRLLRALLPERDVNVHFAQIIAAGTGKSFGGPDPQTWFLETRPLLEAFNHAKFMIEMTVRYSDLPAPPPRLPSGWATLLYLFNIR